jgi:SAM-dependent methyltransferase
VELEQASIEKFIGEFEHMEIGAEAVEMKVKSKNQLNKAAPTLNLGLNKKSKNMVSQQITVKKSGMTSAHTTICPACKNKVSENFGEHIMKAHGKVEFKKAVLKAKENGVSDQEIGALFNITFRQLEGIITEKYGINISILKKPKEITSLEPENFKEETTSVWSFRQRGDWATHDSRYRGNWSPYIPRNVILKYSRLGETVFDYFIGGGTTAVEAKLLGRKCIARDINPAAVNLTKENLKFKLEKTPDGHQTFEPETSVGDARNLTGIKDGSVNLICAHPPYAGIIDYSSQVEGDLSKLSVEDFLMEMGKVADESRRVLKPGGKCAILIGDTRQKKHVIPIGFKTIDVFLNAGFKLKELVIKRQHNCKTTGFWRDKSIKYNFLLLAHEYLPIFENPASRVSTVKETDSQSVEAVLEPPVLKKIDELETTTVWIFPEEDLEKRLNTNVIERYSNGDGHLTVSFTTKSKDGVRLGKEKRRIGLLFIKSPFLDNNPSKANIESYLTGVKEIVQAKIPDVNDGGFLVIQTRDVRINGYIEPLGKRVVDLLTLDNLWLKEVVIVTPEKQVENNGENEDLKITHQYLLIYEAKQVP